MKQTLDIDEDYIEEPTDEEFMGTIFESIIKQDEFDIKTLAVELFSEVERLKERLNSLVSKGLLEKMPEGYKINWQMYKIKKQKLNKKMPENRSLI